MGQNASAASLGILRCLVLGLVAMIAAGPSPARGDDGAAAPGASSSCRARAIVFRSIQADDQNSRIARQYIYQEREESHDLDSSGKIKSTKTAVREVLYIGGKEYERLIEKDGKPLSHAEARKEQAKIDKAAAAASRLTPAERARRDAEAEKERQKERERARYIPDAFHFALLGETSFSGRPVYQIVATPTGNYHGKYDNLLRNVKAKVWIDKEDNQWVRVELEVLNDISFGLVLARLAKGAFLTFEQTRVNDEVWLPKSIRARASARLAILKKFNGETQVTYSGYRKFQSDSRITSVADVDSK